MDQPNVGNDTAVRRAQLCITEGIIRHDIRFSYKLLWYSSLYIWLQTMETSEDQSLNESTEMKNLTSDSSCTAYIPTTQHEAYQFQVSSPGASPSKNDEMMELKEGERIEKLPKRRNPNEKTLLNLPGILIFREFCLEMNVWIDIKKMTVSQLVSNLQKFFFFVRVKPGEILEQLFEQLCLVLEGVRHIDIRKDVRFKKVVRVCKGRVNSFDHIRCNSPQITEQLSMFCLRKLILSTQVRPNHPDGLFNLTLLYIIIYMCKGTTHWTELKALLLSMRKSSFECKADVKKGGRYITLKRVSQYAAGRLYEIPGHPICPFKIFRLYMSKLSASSSFLWQRPKKQARMNESWFYPDPSNSISNEWLVDLTEKASMTVSYTNMSLVLTPRSVMDAMLLDPNFSKTLSEELGDIPSPPELDPLDPENALPGCSQKLEIKLLNSCEAQVEIRLTDIVWKELFPEWDRTRLESGFQNHVDFMKHLLEVHKTCKNPNCQASIIEHHGRQTDPADSAVAEKEEEGLKNNQADASSVTIPINVTQHGIHNSSVLTVVNNGVVPNLNPNSQNVMLPLNALLESINPSQLTNGNLTASSVAGIVNNVVAANPVLSSPSIPSNIQLGAAASSGLPIPTTNLQFNPQTSSANTLLLPTLVGNAKTNTLLTLPVITPSNSAGPVVDSNSAANLLGTQPVIPSAPAGSTESVLNTAQIPAGVSTAPVGTMLEVPSASSDSLNPSSLPDNVRVLELPTSTPSGTTTLLMANPNIIAVPSTQPPHLTSQSNIAGLPGPLAVSNVPSFLKNILSSGIDPSAITSMLPLTDKFMPIKPKPSIPPDKQTVSTSSTNGSNIMDSYISNFSMKEAEAELLEEVPLDLSINKQSKVKVTEGPSSLLSSSSSVLLTKKEVTPPRSHLLNQQLLKPFCTPGVWPDAIPQVPSVPKPPPPPYPGVTQRFLASQNLGKTKEGCINPKEFPGFLKMTLKKRSSTGKSVRELLKKKRRENLEQASRMSQRQPCVLPSVSPSLPKQEQVLGQNKNVFPSPVVNGGLISKTQFSETSSFVNRIDANVKVEQSSSVLPFSKVSNVSEQSETTSVISQRKDFSVDLPSEKCIENKAQSSWNSDIVHKSLGRKSRRKPRQVFKRMAVQSNEHDVIDDIEDFN